MFEIDFYTQTPEAIARIASEKLRMPLEDWERQVWQFVSDWFNQAITSVSVHTSGSTGAPREITHSKTAMLNSAAATCTALNLQTGNRALLCLPANKISGMMMLVRSIYLKMQLLCIKPSAKPLSELSENHNLDFAAFTPMQFHEITNNYSIFNRAEQIRKIILGGEDVRAEMLINIRRMHNEVYITFGMTETISHIALKRLNGPAPDTNFKLLPGIEIWVDDRSCLVVSAPTLGQPNLTTNDVIRLVSDKEFEWLGRIDNVINSGGIKIYPEEIEQQLINAIEAPYFIASKPDRVSGEKLVLALETHVLTPAEKLELHEALGKLEKLNRPKLVLLIPHFIRTSNGKIKRKESLQNIAGTIDVSSLAI